MEIHAVVNGTDCYACEWEPLIAVRYGGAIEWYEALTDVAATNPQSVADPLYLCAVHNGLLLDFQAVGR